jgi:hypothetical protein
VIGCSGIENNWGNNIHLYPNPATDHIFIGGFLEQAEVNLYNSVGEILLSTKINPANNSICIKNYEPGMYYIRMQIGAIAITKKIIKQD